MEKEHLAEGAARHHVGAAFGKIELVIYLILALLLAATALGALASAARQLWQALARWDVGAEAPRVLNELLIVLMAVEVLNTVRISIRSHILVIEPFLVVGLIASIRRILVITLEAATLTKEGRWASDAASSVFRASMLELGLLGAVVLVLVFAITLLRRYAPVSNAS
ncbi:MAG TPA: phosphate-starvation-inducible PsiE family protein [Polyangia bacterium]|jgi:uncharacterized membrane protein (DUF373 family)